MLVKRSLVHEHQEMHLQNDCLTMIDVRFVSVSRGRYAKTRRGRSELGAADSVALYHTEKKSGSYKILNGGAPHRLAIPAIARGAPDNLILLDQRKRKERLGHLDVDGVLARRLTRRSGGSTGNIFARGVRDRKILMISFRRT